MKEAVENVKKELSFVMEIEINLFFIIVDVIGFKYLVKKFIRVKFESLIEDLVEEMIFKIEGVIKDVGLIKNEILEVVMVGGFICIFKV